MQTCGTEFNHSSSSSRNGCRSCCGCIDTNVCRAGWGWSGSASVHPSVRPRSQGRSARLTGSDPRPTIQNYVGSCCFWSVKQTCAAEKVPAFPLLCTDNTQTTRVCSRTQLTALTEGVRTRDVSAQTLQQISERQSCRAEWSQEKM